jgi:hypothetical protein
MSLGIFKKAFSTAQIDNLKSYFSSIFAPSPNYKVYRALMTQSGTNAPTANVLENTLGNIVWAYNSIGTYTGTLDGAFSASKYFAPIPVQGLDSAVNEGGSGDSYTYYIIDESTIELVTAIPPANNVLGNSPIEIIVYN